ncbi:MAG TPA: serine hydrolase [Allosphingosinicella sp.]
MSGNKGMAGRAAIVSLMLVAGMAQAQVQAPGTGLRGLQIPERDNEIVRPATPAQRILETRIDELGRTFSGSVGIAVRDVETGMVTDWRGERFYPQQSVSKFWVAITALQAVDAGRLDLNQRVTIHRADLTLFHQPVAADIGPNGYTTTIDNFMFRALTTSDNTCNDVVLRAAGGPAAVRAMLDRNRIGGIRFGPGERIMQSQIAGMQWQPAFSVGNGFYAARAAVPADRRREAFDNYVIDPIDGATPLGITDGLVRLQRGELLSPRSTARLLSIMSQTRTGRQRLTGGLAPGWRIAHKTGTGQVLGSVQAGYNDIGILTSPEGRHFAVAVMIGRTSVPLPTRMALMQEAVRATIAYNDATLAEGQGRVRTYR